MSSGCIMDSARVTPSDRGEVRHREAECAVWRVWPLIRRLRADG